ncbi:fructosamine kinase family protein [Phototrophicus methaneseepsis]|uniref:Fructosamine kinase family protein n=1 Tax=Phototrophicus methaneseepsis TaxID=2710758 RepID=A0A7S8E5H0_9CHLR|nr:fructosamine kinase family protein [Phototrophicus methaneseepsis]QPC80659.1 fructosamine kinase family protein [Phototrophicus methaneseepsis]
MSLESRIQQIIGESIRDLHPLQGGMVGKVYAATHADNQQIVVKISHTGTPTLHIEGQMLQYLSEHSTLPVPKVLYHSPDLLIMDYVEGQSRFSTAGEQHAAELLADLHSHHADRYGLSFDTLIGSLHQPNTQSGSWIDFFRDQRLLHMTRAAYDAGQLMSETQIKLNQLASQLNDLLIEPDAPSLIHGDVWATNVLAKGDRITAFIDPAIYYAHPEIELAYITLFNTFGRPFFERYHTLKPIADGFFEVRRDIYNLYPLLVHVRLFGGGYEGSVRRILSRFV